MSNAESCILAMGSMNKIMT